MSLWSTCNGSFNTSAARRNFSVKKWCEENMDEFTCKVNQTDHATGVTVKFEISFCMDGLEAARVVDRLDNEIRMIDVWRTIEANIRWA